MSELLIAGGRVVDPARGVDGQLDVLIREGVVVAVAPDLARSGSFERVLDASGLVVLPGLIDMNVQLREPGRSADETIASGAAAAVKGGFTAVAVMPNTEPAIDDEASAEFQLLQGKRAGKAWIYPIGAVSRGLRGDALAEMAGLARGGAVAFSDGDKPLRSAELLRCALLYAKMLDRVVVQHPEDPDLAKQGVMHSGTVSTILGLSGKSAASEEVMVARDLTLAGLTGAKLHLGRISTAGSLELIRGAKDKGVKVTCDVTPHHLTLTDEAVQSFNPCYKVDPPLRTARDVEALIAGVLDGTVDAIASDHAPHSPEKKDVEFQFAPSGVIGLETTLGIVLERLVHQREMPLTRLVELLSLGPARILGLPGGSLAPGVPGDVTLVDLDSSWTVPQEFVSRSKNSPFVGWTVRGQVRHTVVGGAIAYSAGAPSPASAESAS